MRPQKGAFLVAALKPGWPPSILPFTWWVVAFGMLPLMKDGYRVFKVILTVVLNIMCLIVLILYLMVCLFIVSIQLLYLIVSCLESPIGRKAAQK